MKIELEIWLPAERHPTYKDFNTRFFFKLQIGADGRRNQIFLALSTAAEFREHLTQFSDFYSNLGKFLASLKFTNIDIFQ